MKKVLLAITVIVASASAYAQVQPKPPVSTDSAAYQVSLEKYPDGYMMKKGKMMCVKNQQVSVLKRDTTLTNGTVIMSNGNYMKKGGSKMMLKEGEHMDLTGKIMPVSKLNDQANISKKRYLEIDSVKNKKD